MEGQRSRPSDTVPEIRTVSCSNRLSLDALLERETLFTIAFKHSFLNEDNRNGPFPGDLELANDRMA